MNQALGNHPTWKRGLRWRTSVIGVLSCLFALFFLLLNLQCGDDLEIRDYLVPKAVERSGKPSAGLSWKLPKGWNPKPAGNMRLASFMAPAANRQETADVSIVQLAGDGGGLADNINRWRGQIGLPPAGPDHIRDTMRKAQGKMGDFRWIRILNPARPEAGIYAALFSTSGGTLFVKMFGSPAVLKANEKAFLDFCRSLEKKEVQP